MKRMTRTPWFGPKRRMIGWGWTPTSWQGFVVLIVFLILMLGSVLLWHGWGAGIAVPLLIAALLGTAVVTGDPPGWGGRRK